MLEYLSSLCALLDSADAFHITNSGNICFCDTFWQDKPSVAIPVPFAIAVHFGNGVVLLLVFGSVVAISCKMTW